MSWTHLSDTLPKARYEHTCRVCGEVIRVGETHVSRRGIDDRGPFTTRFHIDCESYTAFCWIGDDSDAWDSLPGSVTRDEVRAELRSRMSQAYDDLEPEDPETGIKLTHGVRP